jgi:hypothetical protein
MNFVKHPHHDLLAEANREREVAQSPEGQALRNALGVAAGAYWDFLDRNHLIWEDDADVESFPRIKATALVVTVTLYGTIDFKLKDGAFDRVYGNGVNPDPDGRGPTDIPHEPRKDELI